MSLSEFFVSNVNHLALSIDDPVLRRLFLLTSLGQYGAFGQSVFSEFSQLGLVHLLVMSGSQISFFYKGALWITQSFMRVFMKFPSLLIVNFFSGFLVSLYVYAVSFPEPLTRALLFLWIYIIFKKFKLSYKIVLCFMSHVLLFPAHFGTLSFMLSWVSFMFLICSDYFIKSQFIKILVISWLCQALALILLDLDFEFIHFVVVVGLSNVIISVLYERLYFPVLGAVLACCSILAVFQYVNTAYDFSQFRNHAFVSQSLVTFAYFIEPVLEFCWKVLLLSKSFFSYIGLISG